MASVRINPKVKIGFDELLKGFSQLKTDDIEQFMLEISNLVAQRKAPNFTKREAELLLAINNSFPADKAKEIEDLKSKLQAETITETEHQTYLKLLDDSEARSVERLKKLLELAQLRKVSLETLMNQLGLNPAARA